MTTACYYHQVQCHLRIKRLGQVLCRAHVPFEALFCVICSAFVEPLVILAILVANGKPAKKIFSVAESLAWVNGKAASVKCSDQ